MWQRSILTAVLFLGLTSPGFGQQALQRLLDQIKLPETKPKAPPAGYLGLGAEGNTSGRGVLVKEVVAGAPAEKAGIQPGDVINAINGQIVQTMDDVSQHMIGRRPGDTITITLDRKGETRNFEVLLGKRAETQPVGNEPPPAVAPAPAGGPKLGVRTRALDAELRQQFNLNSDIRGVVIADITPGSPAEREGLPVGGVITAVDGQAVLTPEQLGQRVRAAGPGATLDVQYWFRQTQYRKAVSLAAVARMGQLPPNGPRPADAEVLDFVPNPVGIAQPAANDPRIEQLEQRIRELEERVKQLEAAGNSPRA